MAAKRHFSFSGVAGDGPGLTISEHGLYLKSSMNWESQCFQSTSLFIFLDASLIVRYLYMSARNSVFHTGGKITGGGE